MRSPHEIFAFAGYCVRSVRLESLTYEKFRAAPTARVRWGRLFLVVLAARGERCPAGR
jgi:hypothetical protein